jgi:hypothetical protein
MNIELLILGYYNNAVCMHLAFKDKIRRNVIMIVIRVTSAISAIVLKLNCCFVDWILNFEDGLASRITWLHVLGAHDLKVTNVGSAVWTGGIEVLVGRSEQRKQLEWRRCILSVTETEL